MIIYIAFGAILVAFIISVFYIWQQRKQLIIESTARKEASETNQKLLSQKKSSEVRLGLIAEQLAPFLDNFKYDPKKVKFIGMPIDYIYFGDDEIVIIEVKSGNSQLSPTQRDLKKLIEDKKVRWDTYRIK